MSLPMTIAKACLLIFTTLSRLLSFARAAIKLGSWLSTLLDLDLLATICKRLIDLVVRWGPLCSKRNSKAISKAEVRHEARLMLVWR